MVDYTNLKNLNRGYMKLEVWQRSIDLYKLVWESIINSRIDFKIRAQISDAAQSVSANIAEGYSRKSINEYIHYLYISLGSLAETITRAIGLKITAQISEEEFYKIDVVHYEIENKLIRLIERLQTKRSEGTWNDKIPKESSHT